MIFSYYPSLRRYLVANADGHVACGTGEAKGAGGSQGCRAATGAFTDSIDQEGRCHPSLAGMEWRGGERAGLARSVTFDCYLRAGRLTVAYSYPSTLFSSLSSIVSFCFLSTLFWVCLTASMIPSIVSLIG